MKFLKSNFKLDFTYKEDKFEINDLIFRDKNLSFDSKGYLKLNPYFSNKSYVNYKGF